jgi:hypothetical protein
MNHPDRNSFYYSRRLRLTAAWCLAMLITALPMQASAESAAASEYAIKAAMVFKIAKFVSWPKQAFTGLSEPLSVCVQESNPIAPALSTLSGKPIHGRPFSVRYLKENPVMFNDCQILLVPKNSGKRQTAFLKAISSQPVLTIVENDNFKKQGGIIGLEIKQNRVQFAIDVAASENAGLDISAQLLQLAKIVDNREGT